MHDVDENGGCGGYHDGRRTTQASIKDTVTLLHVAAVGSNAVDTGYPSPS